MGLENINGVSVDRTEPTKNNQNKSPKDKNKKTSPKKYTCPSCGRDFMKLGKHLAQSDCDYPPIKGEDWEILVGSMMGDGSLEGRTNKGNARVHITNTKKEYLWELSNSLGILSGRVRLKTDNSESDKLKTQYYVRTLSHPKLSELDWYDDNGKKKFPENINLTPTVMKHWYCQDGYLDFVENANTAAIGLSCRSQSDILGRLSDDIYEATGVRCTTRSSGFLYFGVNQSERLLDYMGSPGRGYEYKWCIHDRDEYNVMKP